MNTGFALLKRAGRDAGERRNLRRCLVPVLCLILLWTCVVSAGAAAAAELPEPSWEFSLKQKSLFNSHTSYEFGNPFPPGQVPLSRLEFPVNSIWGGFELRKKFSRLAVTAGFMSTFTEQDTGGKLIDSDWDDEADPGRMTIYSASPCRLNIGYEAGGDIDLQMADLLYLPSGFDLRPLIGFRWQRFSLTSHDGIQYNLGASGDDPPVELLPGNGIAFEQNWYRYYLGFRAGYEWRSLPWLHRLHLLTQFDWSYTEGENVDHHLLRAGRRFTEERTTGEAWHAAVGLQFGISRNLDLGIDADYLTIRTTGCHTLRNELFNINTTFTNGVKVWSEQYGITLKLGYRF